VIARIEARRGRKSHAMGICGAVGLRVGGGVGASKLSGVGARRGLSDLDQKIAFRFFHHLDV